jgi:LAO/AO transport system kinase
MTQAKTQNLDARHVDEWVEGIRKGEVRAISRALTAIENGAPAAAELIQKLFAHTGNAYSVGITGAPGTGKSTLVDKLAAHYRAAKAAVGVIAVDPSSPFTGGAILGDRIRMQSHHADAGVFIRSMATRGSLGGLAQATSDAALVLDAAGKQYILIETVGVGQGEVEIVRLADCTVVVLMPGMGDDVQNLKAGLMEIADIFVINKCDREGADRFEEQLRAMLSIAPERDGWRPVIVRTIATDNKGIGELAAAIEKLKEHQNSAANRRAKKAEYWRHRLVEMLEQRLVNRVVGGSGGEKSLRELAEEVAERKKDPYGAVEEMLGKQ